MWARSTMTFHQLKSISSKGVFFKVSNHNCTLFVKLWTTKGELGKKSLDCVTKRDRQKSATGKGGETLGTRLNVCRTSKVTVLQAVTGIFRRNTIWFFLKQKRYCPNWIAIFPCSIINCLKGLAAIAYWSQSKLEPVACGWLALTID